MATPSYVMWTVWRLGKRVLNEKEVQVKEFEIDVGKTYTNKGAGRTRRTVIAIGMEHIPARNDPSSSNGVLYEQKGFRSTITLKSFATWAGKEVKS